MRDFDARLLRLKQVLRVTEDQAVADALGLSKEAFSRRKTRDSFPEDKVRALASSRPDIDVDFVLTGASGEVVLGEVKATDHPAPYKVQQRSLSREQHAAQLAGRQVRVRDLVAHGRAVPRSLVYEELQRLLESCDDESLKLLLMLASRLTEKETS